MFIFYNLIFIVFAIFYLPVYLFKRKFHRGFLMRLGFLPQEIISALKDEKVIWLHAVSVGEAKVAKILYEYLKRDYPAYRIAISTVTATGNSIVGKFIRKEDAAFYFPLDLSFIVKRIIALFNPKLFISFETEIWPNLICQLYQNKIPQILVNGRISDRSFGGYKMIRFLLKRILSKIDLFCMQTPIDSERITFLGAPEERVKVTGNMKFDITDYTDKKTTDSADKLSLDKEEELWVCGSTHPGEEEIILEVYKRLLSEFPNLRLLIAPRHVERSDKIEGLIEKYGFNPLRISNLSFSSFVSRPSSIFILDTIGQLQQFYSLATVVFVGGSLVKKGGQNIIEPASVEKPIIFGPYMFNFADIVQIFLRQNSAIMVKSQEELYQAIKKLLKNPDQARILGQAAKIVALENRGATGRVLEAIKKYL